MMLCWTFHEFVSFEFLGSLVTKENMHKSESKVNVAQHGAFRDAENLIEPRKQLDGYAQ